MTEINSGKAWDSVQEAKLIELLKQDASLKDITKELGRSNQSVIQRMGIIYETQGQFKGLKDKMKESGII